MGGLRIDLKLSLKDINILGDSMLVTNLLIAKWNPKHKCIHDLEEEALDLLGHFQGWNIHHIPRSMNLNRFRAKWEGGAVEQICPSFLMHYEALVAKALGRGGELPSSYLGRPFITLRQET
eukprot:Gb_33286 [translate_table: standard]